MRIDFNPDGQRFHLTYQPQLEAAKVQVAPRVSDWPWSADIPTEAWYDRCHTCGAWVLVALNSPTLPVRHCWACMIFCQVPL